MPLQDKLVPIEELATALGRKPSWLMRNWLRMHQQHGMPRKVPSTWCWPRRAMEAWFEGQQDIPDQVEQPSPPVGLAAIVANENHRLHQRYGGGRGA